MTRFTLSYLFSFILCRSVVLIAGCSQKPAGSILFDALHSSVNPALLFSLGELDLVDPEDVRFRPYHFRQIQKSVNSTIRLNQNKASDKELVIQDENPEYMLLVFDEFSMGINFTHEDGLYQNKLITPLMLYTQLNPVPILIYNDLNSVGLVDLFIGSGFDQPASLFQRCTYGIFDLLPVGNNFGLQPEAGPVSVQGVMKKGTGKFSFSKFLSETNGMYTSDDVSIIKQDSTNTGPLFLPGRHNNTLIYYLIITSLNSVLFISLKHN